MLDSLDPDGRSDVGLPGARTANQNDIVGVLKEVAAMELAHQCLVDVTAGEVEAMEVAISREARHLELIGRRAHFPLRRLGLEQLRQDWDGSLEGRCALFGQFADRLGHAMHLEAFEHDDDRTGGRIMTHGGSPKLCAGRRSAQHWPWAHWSEPVLAGH